MAEAEAVVALVAGGDLLVGDFNAVRPDDEVGMPPPEEELEHVSRCPVGVLLEAGFVDCYRGLHPRERGWTYLARQPWARLDYVFAHRLPRSCDVVETQASDHFALVAEF